MGSPFTQNKIHFFPQLLATSLTPLPTTIPALTSFSPLVIWLVLNTSHTFHLRTFAFADPLPIVLSLPNTFEVHNLTTFKFCWHITSQRGLLVAPSRLHPPFLILFAFHYLMHYVSMYELFIQCVSSHQEYKNCKTRNIHLCHGGICFTVIFLDPKQCIKTYLMNECIDCISDLCVPLLTH